MKKCFLFFLMMTFLLAGCNPGYTAEQRSYYADQRNYVTVTGVVDHIQYEEDRTVLHIGIEECPEGFSDTAFKLAGECLTIARENGIDDVLQLGDEITFTCAPRYFGDGYVVPLAAIAVDGQWLLEFDEGHAALVDWLE